MRFLWLGIFAAVLVWSAIEPNDRVTWWLEVAPALVGLMVLVITRQRFVLTPLLYGLILLHCIVLMVGAHYTYAEVPLFDGLFGAERNNYDKVAHFVQGFVPAMIARELLIRQQVINGVFWRNFVIVCFCLAFSAFYELLEWLAAVAMGSSADAFLGTQGYEWDTQTDMALALLGSIIALVTLGRVHDKQLEKL
ncbi:hypothetical protein BST95_03580 [Halioglobus japonicus]|uniref:DUF2238 domain-containing protein n=1 Tax=Halioglobus japonicus TaxID=930805 RepID=A0AAP8MCP0_9GAMM|nr:DUF2238 domain-containing protein [Halioglobus japonicus]AQA17453.1 hypothetical protein BST95_03580 [Halioglobus japonicus]PLW85377.1 DUF2238 domain-containing protein [Halioglobus japonicus]GHD22038.1 membrane protein [Halioglobus japonicus]